MSHGQDLAVLLHTVSLVTIPRSGTQPPQQYFHLPQPEPGVKAPPFQPSQGLRMVLLVTRLLFKGKVNYKSLWSVLGIGDLCSTTPSYDELQPTKMSAPGGPVQSEGSGKGWAQGHSVPGSTREGAGPQQPHSFWILQHPLMDTAGLGSASCPTRSWWHSESCPKGLGWTPLRDFQSHRRCTGTL